MATDAGRQAETMEISTISDRVAEFLESKGYEDPAAHGVTQPELGSGSVGSEIG